MNLFKARRTIMVALVDHTWSDLASLIKGDFGRRVADQEVARMLVDWFHYRARLIAKRPRQVSISDDVKAQLAAFPAIARIAADFRDGASMAPWLSDRVRLAKAKHRADLMFNDWQISHLHLGNWYDAPDRVKRTGPLLYSYIDNRDAVLLKIGPHGDWSNQEVLTQLLRTRPSIMERWEAKGAMPSRERSFTDEEKGQLRAAGLASMVTIEGRVFMPLGVASSGHATRLVVKTGRFLRAVEALKQAIISNTTPRETRSRLAFPIGLPVQLRLRLEENGDLTLYDAIRAWGFFSEAAPA